MNVQRTLRAALAITDELDPDEQDVVYRAVLDHVRSRRPESVGYLSQLPEPESPVVDPRSVRCRE